MEGWTHMGRMASLLDRSAVAGILMIVIVIARTLLKGSVPKRTFVTLWMIALVRLLCPFSIRIRFSVFSLFGRTRTGMINAVADRINEEASGLYTAVALSRLNGRQHVVTITPVRILWFFGFCLCALGLGVFYIRARRRYAGARPCKDERVREMLKNRRVRRNVRVRISDTAHAPLTYGVWRPVIILPQGVLSGGEDTLGDVLTYALAHIRRWDALRLWAMACALCVHWFNPLCWMMLAVMYRDMELLCDATVLRGCVAQAREPYGGQLTNMEEKHARLIPLCNGFSRAALDERRAMLLARPYASWPGRLAAAALVCVAAMSLTQSAPKAVHNLVKTLEAQSRTPLADTGREKSLQGESAVYTAGEGKEVSAGFYVLEGGERTVLSVRTQSGQTRYALADIAETTGENRFVLYLEEGAEIRLSGGYALHPITRGKVISDKTATAYVGSGMFRAGASVPVGSYSVSLMAGEQAGSYAILDVSPDGKSTSEVLRGDMKAGERYFIRLEAGQIIQVSCGVLECNG